MAEHHAGCAVDAGQAAYQTFVVGKVAVAVHFNEVGKDACDVVQRHGALLVAADFADLPGGELAVYVFGELLAFFAQLLYFGRYVYG